MSNLHRKGIMTRPIISGNFAKQPQLSFEVLDLSQLIDESLDFYRTTKSSGTPDYYILDVGDKITINIFPVVSGKHLRN